MPHCQLWNWKAYTMVVWLMLSQFWSGDKAWESLKWFYCLCPFNHCFPPTPPKHANCGICFSADFIMWTSLCWNWNSLFLISERCYPTPAVDRSFTRLTGIPARNLRMESFYLLSVYLHLYLRATNMNLKLWTVLLCLWKMYPVWWPNTSTVSDIFIYME